ncbi:MAG TPA: DUF2929 family protein [Bacillota bacterium]|nr:DUF2929 family protein [Bacillota bacterium]
MRFILPIIWAFVISGVISYVLSSMASEPFNITATVAVATLISLAVIILGEGVLKETED